MTITTGSFDEHGVPQGARNTLDDIADVDAAEVKEGDTISYAGGRWITIPGNEVQVSPTQPEDMGVELWVNPLEGEEPPTGGGGSDHGALTGLEDVEDHPQYVKDTGDTMTGPLVLDTGVQDPDSPLTITNDDYPSIKFFKRSAPVGLRQWRQYLAGHTGPMTPNHHAMSWMPENDDGTDPPNDPAFRMTRDGRFMLPMNGAVEFRSSEGDIRAIGMGPTSEAGTYGIRVLLDRDANTLGSIGVASPYLPEHATPRSYVDTYQTSGLMVPISNWADYGGTYAGLLCSKSGGMVTLEGLFRRTGPDVIVGSSAVTIGTIPPAFYPTHDITVPAQAWTSGGYPSIRCIVRPVGDIRIQAMPQVTIATDAWVSIVMTYRGA